MSLFSKLLFFALLVACNLSEGRRQYQRLIKPPAISDECQLFRKMCSALCFANVNTDQCWGNPRYTQCDCNDGTVHQLPGYPCEHPDCPRTVVREGTTRKPFQRKRVPIRRHRFDLDTNTD